MTAVLDLGTGFTEAVEAAVAKAMAAAPASPEDPIRWRTVLWTGDPALRVTTRELALALDVSPKQVTRYVQQGMPARERHGFVFVIGDVRRWLERVERVVSGPGLRRAG